MSIFKKIIYSILTTVFGVVILVLGLELLAFIYLEIHPHTQIQFLKSGWSPAEKVFHTESYPFLKVQRPTVDWPFSQRIDSAKEGSFYAIAESGILVPKPDFKGSVKGFLHETGKEVYSVQLTTDRYGRRFSSESGVNSEKRKKHLLVMGCSYVWGDWLSDHQTLPWLINQSQKKYYAYNLSFQGYSAADILARIDQTDFLEAIEPQEGRAVFIFFEDHLKRFFGSMSTMGVWGDHLAYYKEVQPFDFKFQGTHGFARPLRLKIYRWVSSLNLVRLLKIDFPVITQSFYEEYARFLKVIERRYHEKFGPNNQFSIALYPDGSSDIDYEKLISAFKKYNLTVMDYSALLLWQYYSGPVQLLDGHPTEEAHRIFSQILVYDFEREDAKE